LKNTCKNGQPWEKNKSLETLGISVFNGYLVGDNGIKV
jgi:hypothetical protein